MDGNIRIRITGGTNMEKVLAGGYFITSIENHEAKHKNLNSVKDESDLVKMKDGYDVVEITIHKPVPYIDGLDMIAKVINNAAKEQASDIRVEISND